MYADIPVSVLQVPAGEEGELWSLPNFLKEEEKEEYNEEKEKNDEEKEEDEKEKKENDEKQEEMEGKRRDEEDMQDRLVVEDGMMVNFPLVSFPYISCYKVLSANKKLDNHIVAMHKDPASCIL